MAYVNGGGGGTPEEDRLAPSVVYNMAITLPISLPGIVGDLIRAFFQAAGAIVYSVSVSGREINVSFSV